MKPPRILGVVDPGPSFAFDDRCGTTRSLRQVFSLIRTALVTSLKPRRLGISGHEAVFFPMHHTKYAQLAPFTAALESKPLFILAPWDLERIRGFNAFIREAGRDSVLLGMAFPARFWWDLVRGLPFWAAAGFRAPRSAFRRLAQYLELYGMVYGVVRILSASKAKAFFTAYEDSWYSSAVSQAAKRIGCATVNVMHGNCYLHDQFFDLSLVFGEYHKKYLEAHTRSSTRFLISGSTTVKDKGALPRSALAKRLIHFDQPACEALPGPVKAKVMAMLSRLLQENGDISLTIKPHPAGRDEYLGGFLMANHSAAVQPELASQTVSGALEGHGIALTAFSTTGLESIANGAVSLFLNPDGALKEGPLEYMGDFALTEEEELLRLVSRLISDPEFYEKFLERQKRTLDSHFSMAPFDHAGILRDLGLLGTPLSNS